MGGWTVGIGTFWVVISLIWIWIHYEDNCDFTYSLTIFNVIVLVWSLILYFFTDNVWRQIGLAGIICPFAYAVSVLVAFIIKVLKTATSSYYYDWDEIHPVTYTVIAIAVFGVMLIFGCIIPYSNIVDIEIPNVEEKYYELYGGNFINKGTNEEADLLMYVHENDGNYYQFYCLGTNEKGETVVVQFKVNENEVELVINPNGIEEANSDYFVEVTTTYYKEDRNKKPAEIKVASTVKRYKLYLREITFKNMLIVGNDN